MKCDKRIAIIGAGASGCLCAYFLQKAGFDVSIFDKGTPLRTLLPTGGGRCNLAHSEYDFKELVRNYPRGEKFLYSVFSKFSTADTLEIFEELGIKCYTQDNGRIFPESNSAKEVRLAILNKIARSKIIKEEVIDVIPVNNGYKISTLCSQNPSKNFHKTKNNEYFFPYTIVAIGGHSGYELLRKLGVKIVEPKPSLVGLNTVQNFNELSGTVVKSAVIEGYKDDLLFTHFGISGPLAYTISSIKAFNKMPYKLNIDLAPELIDLQNELNIYPHKEIKNILCKFLPQKVVNYLLNDFDITTKAHKINGKTRDLILQRIHNFEVNISGTNKGEETVTAGGIDLNEVNPKTMELKNFSNLYCIGEVLNIDGFCGGFNLQNAWSTAYVAATSIINYFECM